MVDCSYLLHLTSVILCIPAYTLYYTYVPICIPPPYMPMYTPTYLCRLVYTPLYNRSTCVQMRLVVLAQLSPITNVQFKIYSLICLLVHMQCSRISLQKQINHLVVALVADKLNRHCGYVFYILLIAYL